MSAGIAMFVDSQLLTLPEIGTRYRYADMNGHPLEVIVYPKDSMPTPGHQIDELLREFDSLRIRGEFRTVSIDDRGRRDIRIRTDTPGRDARHRGFGADVHVEAEDGEYAWSVAIYLWKDQYIQIRGWHPLSDEAHEMGREFVRQIMLAMTTGAPPCK